MNIQETIFQRIARAQRNAAPIEAQAHFYHDLRFDSLSFISLLVDLEGVFSIVFDLAEMQECLEVGRLVALVQEKTRGRYD
ncbi:MAG: acyl carrier protein [Oscillospiraceae bacterium]|jgi:acyl carrier protein|nr:acyl carrier protein [Oscillospiraceae bacterium]